MPARLNWRERKPAALKVLADEPGDLSGSQDPPASGEWSIWDPSPPPLRRRKASDSGRSSGARAVGPRVRRHPPSRFIGAVAVAVGTITAAAALALGLLALDHSSGPPSQRASSALQASRPSSTGLAKSTPPRPHRSTAARAGSHRGPAERTSRATNRVPKLAAVGAGRGVSATVQYVAPTGPSPTPTSASPPPAETAPRAERRLTDRERQPGVRLRTLGGQLAVSRACLVDRTRSLLLRAARGRRPTTRLSFVRREREPGFSSDARVHAKAVARCGPNAVHGQFRVEDSGLPPCVQ